MLGELWHHQEVGMDVRRDMASLGWTWHIQNRPNKVRYRNLYRRVLI